MYGTICFSIFNKLKFGTFPEYFGFWQSWELKCSFFLYAYTHRLERERQQHDQSDTSSLDKSTRAEPKEKHPNEETQTIPKTLLKAVPGTPLPGKKNWVVGKFGRVLPVVYLRRRDRKKIAKFDPSKTTHCLKRINLQDPTMSVSSLTWKMDSDKDVSSNRLVKMEIEQKSNFKKSGSKQSGNCTNTSAFHENAVDKCRKKSGERMHANNVVIFEGTKFSASDGSDLESDSTDAHSELDLRHSYTKLNKNSSNKVKTDLADVPDRSASTCNISHFQNTITISSSPKKNTNSVVLETATNLVSDINGLQSYSSSKMQMSKNNSHQEPLLSNGVLQNGENNEDLSEESSLTESTRQSYNSSDEMSDTCSNSSKSESVSSENKDETSNDNSSESETVVKKTTGKGSLASRDKINNIDFGSYESKQPLHNDSEEVSAQSPKTKGLSRVINDTQKKLSNDKHLDALEGKKKSVLAQKNVIKDALKDLDSGVQNHDGKKHIIFGDNDDDGDRDNMMEKSPYSLGEKVSNFSLHTFNW